MAFTSFITNFIHVFCLWWVFDKIAVNYIEVFSSKSIDFVYFADRQRWRAVRRRGRTAGKGKRFLF